ncbi:MAG: dicarboxylate/amino acid:cation symporter [Oceanospirillaceae bacterium]|nr:dicarboxylate/amino acid:cation symporter [Oceanospirillaceae bacterium]|tara:strand:+ start:2066 stop:3322 length:1257 start_codon:yes stop_codon:yes gene_type:complete
MSLTIKILIAMAAAIVLGVITHFVLGSEPAEGVRYVLEDLLANGLFLLIGKAFVASLKLLVVPLVFVSLVCGVGHLSDQSRLGFMSLKTILLYLVTTGIAITIALIVANVLNPGVGIETGSTAADFKAPAPTPLIDVLVNIFPSNPFKAFTEAAMLQVIVFAILLGMAIGRSGEYGKRIANTFTDWNEVMMNLVTIVMSFAPIGVFSLLFGLFARQGMGNIDEMIIYMLAVILTLALHAAIVYPTMLKVFTGLSPITFLKKMRPVQLFAFSTASSSATLPFTLETVEHKLGVNNRVASFAVPLGATINMDGTAIMQGVATVFIAQAFQLDMTLVDYLMVIMTAMLASIGTAGVPGVGLVTLAMVLQQVGLPVEGIALIIGVDRLLDMMRTAVNVTGDAMVSTVVAHTENAIDREKFNQ